MQCCFDTFVCRLQHGLDGKLRKNCIKESCSTLLNYRWPPMNKTIKIRASEEESDWRAGSACGETSGYRPRSKPMRPRLNAIFLMGVLLSAIELAGAANVPAVVGAANQNNLLNSGTTETPRHWAADTSNGCKVWSPEPIGNEITVRWSGRCDKDLAQGPGTVRWLSNNKQVAELTGNMEQGKIRGHTTGVEEPGNRIDGMFIDSLPEGEGKASFVDGSGYSGMWHRGRQLGYGIMTFPPAHPQYQEMLKEGRGRRAENGIYMLRGWWEGKTFVLPCDSEEECEKAVVAMMKREQAAAAAKAGAAPAPVVAPAPAAAPVAAPVIPAPIMPAPASASPDAAPVVATPAPASEPPALAPAAPPVLPVLPTPENTATEPMPTAPAPEIPALTAPAVEAPALEPIAPSALPPPTAPAIEPMPPGAPDADPAAIPAATAPAPAPDLPVTEPTMESPIPAPATPAVESGADPAAPEVKPVVAPELTIPITSDAGIEILLNKKNGFS
jgi:hypothetical protein